MTSDSPTGDDCPGVFRLFPAADGGIARVRFPGGRLTADDWALLAHLSTEFGDGDVHLTSRGNLQVRGVTDAESFASAVRDAGRAAEGEHDRVRNILASPLSGRLPGRADLGDLVERLDAGIRSRPASSTLSGRFLFGFDDGSGDVVAHAPDLAARVDPSGQHAEIVVAGTDSGMVAAVSELPSVLLDAALAFAGSSGGDWRITVSAGHRDRVLGVVERDPRTARGSVPSRAGGDPPVVGWVDAVDGSVSLLAVAPFGVIAARLAGLLGAVRVPSTVSADKVIGLHALTESQAEQVVRVLAPRGLVFDASSPWTQVTACTGLPGCARSRTDVRTDATRAIRDGDLPVAGRQHWVGCERRCGNPGTGALVRAAGSGYTVEAAKAPGRRAAAPRV